MGDLVYFKRRPRWWLLRVAPWPAVVLLIAVAMICILGTDGPPPPGINQVLRSFFFGQQPEPAANQPSNSNAIVGRASVIDGDTIDIHGTRIRLHAIDAPESRQVCFVQKKETRCGQRAAFALADKIGASPVSCEPKDQDRYGRMLAVCRLGGEDLNAWMVAQGWALAYRRYSRAYVEHERQASIAKVGMWEGKFVPPWDWRRGGRSVTD